MISGINDPAGFAYQAAALRAVVAETPAIERVFRTATRNFDRRRAVVMEADRPSARAAAHELWSRGTELVLTTSCQDGAELAALKASMPGAKLVPHAANLSARQAVVLEAARELGQVDIVVHSPPSLGDVGGKYAGLTPTTAEESTHLVDILAGDPLRIAQALQPFTHRSHDAAFITLYPDPEHELASHPGYRMAVAASRDLTETLSIKGPSPRYLGLVPSGGAGLGISAATAGVGAAVSSLLSRTHTTGRTLELDRANADSVFGPTLNAVEPPLELQTGLQTWLGSETEAEFRQAVHEVRELMVHYPQLVNLLLAEEYGLAGRTAVVTGGSRGIGQSLVYLLASLGVNVVSVSTSGAEDHNSAFPGRIQNVRANVRYAHGRRLILDEVHRIFGGSLDMLFNCAGVVIGSQEPLQGDVFDQADFIFGVNTSGARFLTTEAAPLLAKSDLAVATFVSSIAGQVRNDVDPQGTGIEYAASKAALNNIMRQLAKLLVGQVRVLGIALGPTAGAAKHIVPPALHHAMAAGTPMRTSGHVGDAARVMLDALVVPWSSGSLIYNEGGVSLPRT